MRFTINASSVSAIDATARKELEGLVRALHPGVSDETLVELFTTGECTEFANHSLRRVGAEWVLEINDEVLFKYLRLYGRVAKFITPFVAPLKALIGEVADDVEDIKRWMSLRK